MPTRCKACKHDNFLIKGAIGSLRDNFNFPIEAKIEQRGLIFKENIAVVRNKNTGEPVALVMMNNEGFLFIDRVAVAINSETREAISTTKEGQTGIFFTKRSANTFDANSGTLTHVTTIEERGILFRKCVTETKRR